jgi:hypothetical protein
MGRKATKFRDIQVGKWFDFISGSMYDSFFRRCVKTSSRAYIDSEGVRYQVGTINAAVYHVSDVK